MREAEGVDGGSCTCWAVGRARRGIESAGRVPGVPVLAPREISHGDDLMPIVKCASE